MFFLVYRRRQIALMHDDAETCFANVEPSSIITADDVNHYFGLPEENYCYSDTKVDTSSELPSEQKKMTTGLGKMPVRVAAAWKTIDPSSKHHLQQRATLFQERYRAKLAQWKEMKSKQSATSATNMVHFPAQGPTPSACYDDDWHIPTGTQSPSIMDPNAFYSSSSEARDTFRTPDHKMHSNVLDDAVRYAAHFEDSFINHSFNDADTIFQCDRGRSADYPCDPADLNIYNDSKNVGNTIARFPVRFVSPDSVDRGADFLATTSINEAHMGACSSNHNTIDDHQTIQNFVPTNNTIDDHQNSPNFVLSKQQLLQKHLKLQQQHIHLQQLVDSAEYRHWVEVQSFRQIDLLLSDKYQSNHENGFSRSNDARQIRSQVPRPSNEMAGRVITTLNQSMYERLTHSHLAPRSRGSAHNAMISPPASRLEHTIRPYGTSAGFDSIGSNMLPPHRYCAFEMKNQVSSSSSLPASLVRLKRSIALSTHSTVPNRNYRNDDQSSNPNVQPYESRSFGRLDHGEQYRQLNFDLDDPHRRFECDNSYHFALSNDCTPSHQIRNEGTTWSNFPDGQSGSIWAQSSHLFDRKPPPANIMP